MPAKYYKRRLLDRVGLWRMQNLRRRNVLVALSIVAAIFLTLPFILVSVFQADYAAKILGDSTKLEGNYLGIVFGTDASNSKAALLERVSGAVELYKQGKVSKLLLSGTVTDSLNQPSEMAKQAEALGVPTDKLVVDYLGETSYHVCYRAKSVFKINKAIIVSHPLHLNRALYLCNTLGIEALGQSVGEGATFQENIFLEGLALLSAFWQTHINPPEVASTK